jgi:cytochrome P450
MLEQLTGHEDPHPIYEQIRARGPLSQDGGLWVTTDYATANRILRDRRFGVRHTYDAYPGTSGPLPESFLDTDPPDHTRLRRLAAPAFSPKKIDEYRVASRRSRSRCSTPGSST